MLSGDACERDMARISGLGREGTRGLFVKSQAGERLCR